MKKVLIIAYDFPPLGGAAAQRIVKFVKYLPQLGWAPTVLTVRKGVSFNKFYDESQFADIPEGTKIYRSRCPETRALWRALGKRLESKPAQQCADRSRSATNSLYPYLKRAGLVLDQVFTRCFLPDTQVAWLPFGVSDGLRIMKREAIDVIFSSSPPPTAHLIALGLKRVTGRPWIADFRDPWTENIYLSAGPFRKGIEKKMENSVLRSADKITCVSDPMISSFLKNSRGLDEKKFVVITNGFDPPDFLEEPVMRPGRFVITHSGSLYRGRNPRYFLEALHQLSKESPSLGKKILVRFIGSFPEETRRQVKELGLDSIVENMSYVSHRENIQYLLGSSILLLIVDYEKVDPGIYTTKLFEYIGARKPILALAPPCAATELIKSAGLGIVVSPMDAGQIKSATIKLCQEYKTYSLQVLSKSEMTEKFKREKLTGQLASALNEILTNVPKKNLPC